MAPGSAMSPCWDVHHTRAHWELWFHVTPRSHRRPRSRSHAPVSDVGLSGAAAGVTREWKDTFSRQSLRLRFRLGPDALNIVHLQPSP